MTLAVHRNQHPKRDVSVANQKHKRYSYEIQGLYMNDADLTPSCP